MTTHRERVKSIFSGKVADRTGLWLGNPDGGSWPGLLRHCGVPDEEAARQKLNDDFRWFMAGEYQHPEGSPAFPRGDAEKHGLGVTGPLADCKSVAEVEAFPWPDPAHLDFSAALARLDTAGDVYRAGGMWGCHFDILRNLFGFEECLVKMHTHPQVIEAAMAHIAAFVYEGSHRFFHLAGDRLDGQFFASDLGTQLDLMISPEHFQRYLLPHFQRLIALAHEYGYQVVMHSCGAIHKIIPDLIDAGLDALHPLQAKALNMDAATLARDFKGKIAFMGGIDTQDLLVNATPAQVRDEVHRIRGLLGTGLVVSPSHESIMPNVPPANIEAMAEAANE
jgi:uroporphyrinogen decarboxylase